MNKKYIFEMQPACAAERILYETAIINASSLIRFAIPTIIADVFIGIYTTVDGIFVFNLIGTSAFSAVSVVMSAAGIAFRKSVLMLLGADESLFAMCEAYAVLIFICVPPAMLHMMFQMYITNGSSEMVAMLTFLL